MTRRATAAARTAAALLLALLTAGCGSDSTGPDDGTATIFGTVTTADGSAIAQGRVAAYTSTAALQNDEPAYEAQLQGGPGQYTFRLEGLAPADYALAVCGRAGALEFCEAVSTDQIGPRVFRLRAGDEVELRIQI